MLKSQFIGRNIDLTKLAEKIAKIFESKFEVKIEETNENIILNFRSINKRKNRHFIIRITGRPNDFIVSFESPFEHYHFLESSFIWQFIGAGLLLLKKYEEREFYQKIEEEFWNILEKLIVECPYKLSSHS